MLFSDAIDKVRTATLHDVDTQFTDDKLLPVLYDEYRRQRRWLCTYVPTLCEATETGLIVTSDDPVIEKADLQDFERLVLLEKLYGSVYVPVDVSSGFNRSLPDRLSVHETPTTLLLSPSSIAGGTYQITYLVGAPSINDNEDLIDLPGGLEDVVVHRGCAWARQRHNEDRRYHEEEAVRIQTEAYSTLKSRYGSHGVSGLKRERRMR